MYYEILYKKRSLALLLLGIFTICIGLIVQKFLAIDKLLFSNLEIVAIFFVMILPMIILNYKNHPFSLGKTVVFSILYLIALSFLLPIYVNYRMLGKLAIPPQLVQLVLESIFQIQTVISIIGFCISQYCLHNISWMIVNEIHLDHPIIYFILFTILFLIGISLYYIQPLLFLGIIFALFYFQNLFHNLGQKRKDMIVRHFTTTLFIIASIYIIGLVMGYMENKDSLQLVNISIMDYFLQKENLIVILVVTGLYTIPDIFACLIGKPLFQNKSFFKNHQLISYLFYLIIYLIILIPSTYFLLEKLQEILKITLI